MRVVKNPPKCRGEAKCDNEAVSDEVSSPNPMALERFERERDWEPVWIRQQISEKILKIVAGM